MQKSQPVNVSVFCDNHLGMMRWAGG